MANNVTNDSKGIIGCIDPQAINYNPLADTPCGPLSSYNPDLGGTLTSGCCVYEPANVSGCMDPQANNFNPNAIVACGNCCEYGTAVNVLGPNKPETEPPIYNPGGTPTPPDGGVTPISCEDLFVTIIRDNLILGNSNPIKEECCNENLGVGEVYWDGNNCFKYTETGVTNLCEGITNGTLTQIEFENRVVCIDCDNFAWWDNLYTTTNGSSLQEVNQDLWDFLVDVITSDPTNPLTPQFGNGSFYVDSLTGEPIISQNCCDRLPDSNFSTSVTDLGDNISACLCDSVPQTEIFCECLTTIEQFVGLVSTDEGKDLYLNVNTLTSLGLTTDQAIFVTQNLFSLDDNDGDGIPDSTNARVLVSNALYTTGGFYVCYDGQNTPIVTPITIEGTAPAIPNAANRLPSRFLNTSKPVYVNSEKCQEIGGFYDGIVCYCKSQDVCNLNLTDVTIITELDAFNQQVTIARTVSDNGSISESCCLKIASENNLPWVYQEYNGIFECYTKDPDPCLPLEFKLNQNLIKPECETPLDISASFYFGVPENPCIDIIDEDDDVVITDPEIEPCLLSFDENNNLIDFNSTIVPVPKGLGDNIVINPDLDETSDRPCCFNPTSPITAVLIVKDDKNNIVHTGEQFSTVELETWVDVNTTFELPLTGNTEGYNVSLQFTSGLNCCCTYDIFLDNFKFSCNQTLTEVEIIRNSCPGFDIVPVIDNKKSWVYNPGKLGYSNIQNQAGALTDDLIIKNGKIGLINGYGEINRTFAPSPDADLPWRYTDYFNQSSVLEKHSNLVLNSKELYLTFDMCNIGGPCPDGYTLSAGTETCYRTTIGCPDGFILSGGTCITSGSTCDCLNIEWALSGGTTGSSINLEAVGVSNGKNVWLFDVDGNTHSLQWLAGSQNYWAIFESSVSSLEYFYSADTTCPTTTLVDWTPDPGGVVQPFTALTITQGICTGTTASTINVTLTQKSDPLACKTKLTLLELEGYKKTFQSFWVQFVEQFVPATTIFVSGEKWCNRPDEICVQYEECDFDFEFVEGDVTTIPNLNIFNVSPPTSPNSGNYDPNTNDTPTDTPVYDTPNVNTTGDGPIETPSVSIIPTPKEPGETIITPSFIDDPNGRLGRKDDYLKRLQPTETIIE